MNDKELEIVMNWLLWFVGDHGQFAQPPDPPIKEISSVVNRFESCSALLLEANKDSAMLQSSLAKSEERVKELEEVANENYTDLLEQMDEAWGSAMEIGRPEVNAMIESRRVHKPTSSLREKNTRLTTALEKLKDREWVATQFFMVGVTPEGEFDSFKVWDFIFAELDKIVEGRNDNQ